ncbi:RNase A-like domain-containing protein [Phytohabitans houttuyneae]|uniref:Hint domain-containing protein n=2 Tax=Phytohabitans houttuyneae TaxID=1076126 RepID=A0A6V8JV07_9ACTN|nr:RNase A-like domain-containing protein [Phytohabitans houttuyneae]GFJ76442.1 hypothetical protein Phou_006220 [Phytohabitans houttuyneae]
MKNADKLREILRIVDQLKNGCKIGSSFVPGTRVLLGDGASKPIEDVRVGDAVLAAEPAAGRTGPRAVTALLGSAGDKQIVDVAVDDDGDPKTPPHSVSATGGHPFWVPQLGRWVPAKSLTSGVMLRTDDGTGVQVVAVSRRTARTTVHNLTVAELSTYFVLAGEAPLLVHNCRRIGDDEGRLGAHTKTDHVDPSDSDIVARAVREGGDVGKWKTMDVMEQAVNSVLDKNKTKIDNWVKRCAQQQAIKCNDLPLRGQFGDDSLGWIGTRDGTLVQAGNSFRVILRWGTRSQGARGGFVVYTAYPVR